MESSWRRFLDHLQRCMQGNFVECKLDSSHQRQVEEISRYVDAWNNDNIWNTETKSEYVSEQASLFHTEIDRLCGHEIPLRKCKNMLPAMDFLRCDFVSSTEDRHYISPNLIVETHERIYDGGFRTKNKYIRLKHTGVHYFPLVKNMAAAVLTLTNIYNGRVTAMRPVSLVSTFELAGWLCFMLMQLQPFAYGNKRIALLMANRVLMSQLPIPITFVAKDIIYTFNDMLHSNIYQHSMKARPFSLSLIQAAHIHMQAFIKSAPTNTDMNTDNILRIKNYNEIAQQISLLHISSHEYQHLVQLVQKQWHDGTAMETYVLSPESSIEVLVMKF